MTFPEAFQAKFSLVDGLFVQSCDKESTFLVPGTYWPNGRPKSRAVQSAELKYGACFTLDGSVLCVNPESRYQLVRQLVADFYFPYITPKELENYQKRTENFEVVTYEGLRFKPARKIPKWLVPDIGKAMAITGMAVWDTDQGLKTGVSIWLNKKKLEHEAGVLKRKAEDDVFYSVIDRTLAHELTHHMLRAIKRNVIDFRDKPFEEIIDKLAKCMTLGLNYDPKEVGDFIDDARFQGILLDDKRLDERFRGHL